MGLSKSKFRYKRNKKEKRGPTGSTSPDRFFSDHITIDLDALRSACLSEDLDQHMYCIHYDMKDDSWCEGEPSTHLQVIKDRLKTVQTAHEQWRSRL